MDGDPRCERCGLALAGQAVGELCANCLLKLALDPPGQKDEPTDGVPPTPPISGELKRVRYFGDYELLEEIARGGMGVVYRARQVSLNRSVALKMILTGDFSSAATVERFQTEAEAAARLEHPNIVPIYEIGAHEGQRYFSMRFLEGGTLTQAVAREKYSPRRAAQLVMTVARAVHYAHQHGILHRDLKPGNILFDQVEQPYVADFGLAKVLDHDSTLTQSAVVLGTPSYMAPEQAAGHTKQLSTAADVYSLGAVVYELLTGRPPFRGPTPAETMRQVMEVEPERPRLVNPAVDRDLETVCLKCLEKDPRRRYGSTEGLAEDLQRWLDHEPIVARPISGWERLAKWTTRKPTSAALAGVSGLATVLFITGLLISNVLITRKQQEIVSMNRRLTREQAVTKDALRLEQRASYYNRIALADRELSAADRRRAERILDECPPDLVGWEWYYLKRLCNPPVVLTVPGHIGRQTSPGQDTRATRGQFPEPTLGPFPLSNDGRRMALAEGNSVKLRDATNGAEIRTFRVEKEMVACVALSPNGQLLAAAEIQSGGDMIGLNRVYLWDTTTGLELLNFQGASNDCKGLHFSSDNLRLVAIGGVWRLSPGLKSLGEGTEVRGWDTQTGRLTLSFTLGGYYSAALSPDGSQLAVSVEPDFQIWDLAIPKLIATLTATLSKQSYQTRSLAFSPDGQHLAIGKDFGELTVLELKRAKVEHTIHHPGGISSVAYSPDGKQIAGGGVSGRIWIADAVTGRENMVLEHPWEIAALAFSPDGRRLFAANASGPKECKVWDLAAPPATFVLEANAQQGWTLAFSPDGKHLAGISDNENVKIWNIAARQAVFTLEAHAGDAYGLAYSGDGKRVAVGYRPGAVKIWDTSNGQEIQTLRGNQRFVYTVAFSPNGRRLASASMDGILKVWDLSRGEEVFTLTNKTTWYTTVVYSPDGRQIASGSQAENALVWNAETGQELFTLSGHIGSVNSVAFSRDGTRLAAASDGGTIKLWNPQTGHSIWAITNHNGFMTIAFSPIEQRLAATSADGVKLYDLDGNEILTLTAVRESATTGFAFSPDGRYLAAGNGNIKVWDGPRRKVQSATGTK